MLEEGPHVDRFWPQVSYLAVTAEDGQIQVSVGVYSRHERVPLWLRDHVERTDQASFRIVKPCGCVAFYDSMKEVFHTIWCVSHRQVQEEADELSEAAHG